MVFSKWALSILVLLTSISKLAHAVQDAYIPLGSNRIEVFQTVIPSMTPIYIIPDPGDPQLVVFNPTGSKAFAPNFFSNDVLIIDTSDGSVLSLVSVAPSTNPIMVAITPDGARAYVLNFGTTDVQIIDTSTYNLIGGPIALPGAANSRVIKITPDGTKAFIANLLSMNLSVITIPGGMVSTIATGNRPYDLAFTPDGTKLYVPNQFGNTVTIINPMTNAVLATAPLPVGAGPEVAVTTPDSQKAYIANANTDNVSVFSTAGLGNTLLATVSVGMTPITMAVTPDGSKIYTGNSGSKSVTKINNSDYTTTDIPLPGAGSIQYLAITPDGSKVYVITTFGNVLYVVSTSDNSVQQFPLSGSGSFISFGPGLPSSPSISVSGFQTKNRFFTQTDIINVLNWQTNLNNANVEVIGYQIYRDENLTDLAGFVPANGPLIFEDHNRRKGVVYTYYVVILDANGDLVSPTGISITP